MNRKPEPLPLKFAIELIPVFDGGNIPVEDFIKKCKIAENSVKVCDKNNIQILIINKIKGVAYDLIQGVSNFYEILKTLRICFSKTQDLDEFEDQLRDLRQNENENVAYYGARIKKILYRGVDFAEENFSSENLFCIINSLKEKANKAFIKGIRDNFLNSRIADKTPKSLDDSLKLAIKFEKESFDHTRSFKTETRKNEEPSLSRKEIDNDLLKTLKINKIKKRRLRNCHTCGNPNHIKIHCPFNRSKKVNTNSQKMTN